MITTIIFDMDDTLFDEVDYCRSGFVAAAEYLAGRAGASAEEIFDSLWKQFSSGERQEVFNRALEELGIAYDDEFIGELVEFYRNHKPNIELPDESRDILEWLKDKYSLALLTDGFLPGQELKVEALGIEKYFKCIVYTERLGREFWKPSPAGYEKILEELNVEPGQTVCIADNEWKDFIVPNRLGMVSVQIIRPARIHLRASEHEDGKARYVINEILELEGIISSL